MITQFKQLVQKSKLMAMTFIYTHYSLTFSAHIVPLSVVLCQGSFGDLVNGSGHCANIAWGERHHGDAAVLGHEHTKLLLQACHLFLVYARVAEHANLLCNVGPVMCGTCDSG